MKIIITKDNIEGGTKAFEIIKTGMKNGAKVLGLATGSSPIPLPRISRARSRPDTEGCRCSPV